MIWKVPRIWENEDVWILGGGPSVLKQFEIPNKLIKDVMDGTSPPSVYSSYLSKLHDKHVIGINVAFMIGDWMDMIFFGDDGFFKRYESQLSEYRGLKVTCTDLASTNEVPWVKYLPKDKEHVKGITRNPSKVSWNHNSGAAAISLAVHTGASKIILLGFDMNVNEDKNMHWHDIYKRGKIETPKDWKHWQPILERQMLGFKHIAQDAKEIGVTIINASPTSSINSFPKTSIKYLL
jgi:hypothetical protein